MEILKGIVPNITNDFSTDDEKFNSLLELGETYFSGNEFDKSLSAYEKAVQENPKSSGGWLGKALSHLASADVIGINEVDVKAYLDSAIKYGDQKVIEKYLIGVTLYYSYNYAAAIKLLIDQTNQAIAEKKRAQIQAVVGLATSVIGGSIANKSKGSFGKMVGYSMLAGGGGVTVKKGFDSFKLDQLSKSLYGNALAQTLVSVPVIKQCNEILKSATGDLHHNTSVILESWKESVIYLFQNEKLHFVETIKKLENVDILLNDDWRADLERKVDEMLYFMDMVGLDESNDYRAVMSIKKSISSFKEKFSKKKRADILSAKSKLKEQGDIWFNVVIWAVPALAVCAAFLGKMLGIDLDSNDFVDGVGTFIGISFVVSIVVGYRLWIKYSRKKAEINSDAGLDIVETEINQIMTKINSVQINRNEFDLNLLGT